MLSSNPQLEADKLIPTNVADLREVILDHRCLLPQAGKSKTGLTADREIVSVSMSGFTGLREYEPSEYTFTALAGTKISEIETKLAEHGQYLPFDPPLVGKGATLGGTLASGLSGSGRFRYGGVRDFILGVVFLDGSGRLIKSGGRVVKNAAGFDISKLMVGSLGTFGALIEMTFKVFPAPAATRTIIADVPEFSRALDAVMKLSISPFDLHCLDIHANGQRIELIIRIAGPPDTLEERIERITAYVGEDFEVFENQIELDYWKDVRDFKWRSDELNLIKVPVTPRQVKLFDNFLGSNQVIRRYAAGANLAWVAWPAPLDDLDNALEEKNLSGLVVLGSSARARIGSKSSNSFYRRVKQGLDPSHRWAEI